MLMSWLNITMQNTHILSKRIPAGKHDFNTCKNICNLWTPLSFWVTGGKMQHNFFKALSFKHKPEYSEYNSGLQDENVVRSIR